MGSVEDELDIKTLNALRGTVDVERRLRIEMSTGTPSISDSAYAIKIRVKEDYKIVEKVVRKRRDKNDPLYNVDRLRDIVGLRIVTLYRLDALTIIPLLLEKIATGSKSSSGLFMPWARMRRGCAMPTMR
jgi:ppGpp synthetase/RelA/SpoT-type nucleotidyltranferase